MPHKKKRTGTLLVPSGAHPETHELRIGKILTESGNDVVFIVPIDSYKIKTPDIYIGGSAWEIKSPRSESLKSLENQIHKATKQSRRIIIDTSRTSLDDSKIMRRLTAVAKNKHSLQNLKIITKNAKIIDIK